MATTTTPRRFPMFGRLALVGYLLGGCGDQCERLCRDVSVRLEQCVPESWDAFGARSRNDFVVKCRAEWDRRSDDLTSSNLNEALEVCKAGRFDLGLTTCDDLEDLYGLAPVADEQRPDLP